MPNILEMRVIQKERLFDLLILEKANTGITIKGLALQISKAKAVMEQEDIAFVEKLVAQENDL